MLYLAISYFTLLFVFCLNERRYYVYALSIPPSKKSQLRTSALEFTKNRISVLPVTTQADVFALAEIRYAEWMTKEENPPSQAAFRAATHDIHSERASMGAIAVLARISNIETEDKTRLTESVVVGAAELSPVEFQGAMITNTLPDTSLNVKSGTDNAASTLGSKFLYVTDVVTCKNHRRMGVGEALMSELERLAVVQGAIRLFLHVKAENVAAFQFYSNPKLGYAEPPADILARLDSRRLADNAGADGQILLCKELQPQKEKKQRGGGFGRKK